MTKRNYSQTYFLPVVLLLCGLTALAQTTAFTYQGQLRTSGAPANSAHDFEFKLFDALNGGNQLGATNTINNVTVTNGVFTLTLDFGAQFNGQPRWLEIAARTTGGGAFTPLTPRQPLTSTPYAVRSLSAGSADGLSASCVGCVTSTQISSVPAGSGSYVQNQNAATQASANFNISGTGTANSFNAATQYNLGGNRILSAPGDRNTLLGANSNVSAANLVNVTAIGANALVEQSNALVLGGISGVNGAIAHTRVGIGTTTPDGQLELSSEPGGDNNLFVTAYAQVPNVAVRRANGTSNTPAAVAQDDPLGIFAARGYTGTGFSLSNRAGMSFSATENWTATGNGTRIQFFTTNNGGLTGGVRMTVEQNGNVGIGTGIGLSSLTASSRLHVVDSDGFSGTIRVGGADLWSAGERRLIAFGDSLNTYVGEEDADDRLVVRGRLGVRFKVNQGQMVGPEADDSLLLGGPSNRWKEVWAVDGTINTSDARLKTGVANLSYGLRHLMQLRPVSFQWKDRAGGRTQLGLLAQEVEQVIPEAVVRGADEATPLGMNYTTLVPVLINSVKELEGQLESLRAEKAALAARLTALEKRLSAKRRTTVAHQQRRR